MHLGETIKGYLKPATLLKLISLNPKASTTIADVGLLSSKSFLAEALKGFSAYLSSFFAFLLDYVIITPTKCVMFSRTSCFVSFQLLIRWEWGYAWQR